MGNEIRQFGLRMQETEVLDSETKKCTFFQKPTHGEGEDEAQKNFR